MADILIVEDERLQRALIKRFVRPEHTVVGCVVTGGRAFEFAIRYKPDVVIMDVDLEEGGGITATNWIKKSGVDTSIIISTAYVSDDVKEAIQTTPVEGYLIKPYSEQELLNTIEQAIQ